MRVSKLLAAALAAPLLQYAVQVNAADGTTAQKERDPMQLQASYPVIVTDKLGPCRDFYARLLDFEVVFEATWFVYLASGGIGIAFMSPDHPSQPPGPERFSGQGMFLTLQTADAAAAFERVKQAGAKSAYPLRDEPWGQRRFGLVDPAGMWVDVVEQIEPSPGYWDKYMPR